MDSKPPTPPQTVEEDAIDNNDNITSSGDELEQPWKVLVEEIEKENKANPLGQDFYPCADGFYAHSLAA
ncbi:hypothetical protein N7445_005016 [Penicillium cf. griseofulvum]|nr:hypothetical protein N7445_005016 [Penicillium cf. griseofulvum]